MPLYDYRCENGHTFEVMQRMSEDPITECTECGAPATRVLHAPAVHFKGSGFYTTDYGRKKTGSGSSSSDDSGSSSSSESKKSESKSSDSGGKAETKSSSSASSSD